MNVQDPSLAGTPGAETVVISKRRLALYKAALKRAMRRVRAYRRRLRPRKYALKLFNRMTVTRFHTEFLFPRDMPAGLKVLTVLPHHHEAAKIGGLTRALISPDDNGRPRNTVHAVVVMPSHRSISSTAQFQKREDMIDAVNREALSWAYMIGLDLGLPPWDFRRTLKDPRTELPGEMACARRRIGDQFVYGPDGAYRFFNAWETYDSGELDPNQQQVVEKDQKEFSRLIEEERPDIVLLPDQMDAHPSHRTTREITLEALRHMLAGLHAKGVSKEVTLMEYASFQLITPPRFNLYVMAPKEVARMKTEANKVLRLQTRHDYEMDQIMAERITSIAAGDEFHFARSHPEKLGFARRLSQSAPSVLPANITAENYTVSVLRVTTLRGKPIVRETRLQDIQSHFRALGAAAASRL